jgi:hypothetical protein
MNELAALRLAVQELYGMILELDPDPAPVEDYVCRAAGVAARAALGPLWPASGFATSDEGENPASSPLVELVEHRSQVVGWDAFEKATEARLGEMFSGGAR